MNNKILRLVSIVSTVLIVIVLVNIWNQDNAKIKVVNRLQSDDLFFGISLNNSTGNLLHKIRYGSNQKITCELMKLSEKGSCNPFVEIRNGYIQMVWKEKECINIVYQKGKYIYNNTSGTMRLYTYNLKENRVISDKILNNRIWGIDYIDDKPIYDIKDISIKSGLASNIYCDELKWLYFDGNKLIEYDKESKKKKEVLELQDSYFVEIGRFAMTNAYALLCANQYGKAKLYILNEDYSIALQKEIEFESRCSSIGRNDIILIDDNNNIMVIGTEGDMKSSNLLQLDDRESILDISYHKDQNVHIIVTNNSIIKVDFEKGKVVSKCKLSENLFNLSDLGYVSN